ncbi:MHC class I heavy chain [Salipiger mangrovisoli]|uniref:MHC class I heavy chain n=1 Tax=Salipiger mangrovisoli TaxID=2865933 RepID=A0ABR9X566_9RHOB|nr:MHC class I heavy chain [Salipiger mangrovisoli]MBE9638743.1 MHC class I heavy chain [Salipiger mangrovisoli]
MSAEWTNIQIMECEDVIGRAVTVFRQSDGTRQRYVLGNGRKVEANADGTFLIPESATELRVMGLWQALQRGP